MKRFDQINMVPFIDIVLVMLAIVMTTASFVSKGFIDVDLPEAQNTAGLSAEQELKEISIDVSGSVFYQGSHVALAELEKSLHALPEATQFHLRVDKQADFEFFVAVIDILKRLSLDNIAIETVSRP